MATLLHVSCIILGSLAGFVIAWMWRGSELRSEMRRAAKSLGFMISERDDKIKAMTYEQKKVEATMEAQSADLETLRSGFAEAEKMMEDDARELRREMAAVRTKLAETEARLKQCRASLDDRERTIAEMRGRVPANVTEMPGWLALSHGGEDRAARVV